MSKNKKKQTPLTPSMLSEVERRLKPTKQEIAETREKEAAKSRQVYAELIKANRLQTKIANEARLHELNVAKADELQKEMDSIAAAIHTYEQQWKALDNIDKSERNCNNLRLITECVENYIAEHRKLIKIYDCDPKYKAYTKHLSYNIYCILRLESLRRESCSLCQACGESPNKNIANSSDFKLNPKCLNDLLQYDNFVYAREDVYHKYVTMTKECVPNHYELNFCGWNYLVIMPYEFWFQRLNDENESIIPYDDGLSRIQ
jgi:hypothetical protein